MTTVATEKEEDLIILSDDSSSTDTSIMDFDFGSQNTTSNTISMQEISTIDFSPSLEEDKEMVLEDEVKTISDEAWISFDENLFSLDNPEVTKTTLETSTESKEIDFGFWDVLTETQENNIFENLSVNNETTTDLFSNEKVSVSQAENFDRNAILDEVIAKMQLRKSSISNIKLNKQSKVDELNTQITSLKSQVSDLELEIKDLEKEDSALDLDILSIEKMKESVLEITTDRPRKHNLSNIKK